MALADPQSLKFGAAAAATLPRTSVGANSSIYRVADGTAQLTVSHQYGKRQRRSVRVEQSKIAVDPLTSTNQRVSMSAYVVIDTPQAGFTVAEAQDVLKALTDWLTPANAAKILGGES